MTNTVTNVQARLDKIEILQQKLPNSVTSGDLQKDSEIKAQVYIFDTTDKTKQYDLNNDKKIDFNEFWRANNKTEFMQIINSRAKSFKDPEALEKFQQSYYSAYDASMRLESSKIQLKCHITDKMIISNR